MKFKDYLQQNDITQLEFSLMVGASQSHVSRVATGAWSLKGRVARKWAEATGWSVTPHELCPEDYPNPTDGLPPEIQFTILNAEQLNHENHPND